MSTIIISIIAILGWTSIFSQTFTTTEGFRYKFKLIAPLLRRIEKINITRIEGHEGKPLNCAYCLSFWVGLIFSIGLLDISYMVIFLYFAKQD
mgnify:CR=1 FL=1|jgi:hypothetical protein